MIEIREMEKGDLRPLLSFWNRNVIYDRLTMALLEVKTYGDMDFDPSLTLIAEESGRIVGFMMGVTRREDTQPNRGWIKLFVTDVSHRRQGIASELLQRIETELIRRGVRRLQLLDTPGNYLQPGIDPRYTEAIAFAERRGFQRFNDTSNLEVDLIGQTFGTKREEARLTSAGFEIRRARAEDWPQTQEFLRQHFLAWIPEVRVTFQNRPISLHLALFEKKIEAFSAYDANNLDTGWFGPMGTNPNLRGKGVGGVLLRRCLRDMKRQGHKISIIPWVGPIPFYLHYANAKVARVFWRYAKEISQSQV